MLCDLRLPDLDGLDVLQTLHAEQPDLPLVVVSGTGVMGDAIEALRKGAWDFVTKPIQDMAMLEHAIVAALDKARLISDNHRFQRELEQANRLLRQNLDQFEQDAAAGRSASATAAARRTHAGTLPLQSPPAAVPVYERRLRRLLRDRSGHLGFYLADVPVTVSLQPLSRCC